MDRVALLKNKEVKVKEAPKWGVYLREQWESHFANHIVDKDFNWTFVKTHETGLCGPYFSRKSRLR